MVMSALGTDAELFEAVSHPLRVQILHLLREHPYRFSDLKRALGIKSSGNVTHHLTKLEGLVGKQANGEYALSKLGRDALLVTELGDPRNRKVIVQLSVVLSTLIFYALFLTFATLVDFYWMIALDVLLAGIYYLAFAAHARRRMARGNYKFIFGRAKRGRGTASVTNSGQRESENLD